MNIRRRVKLWAVAKGVVIEGDLRTSKLYPAEESRSGRAVWWVEILLAKLNALTKFDVFCEKDIEVDDFHHLSIPAADLQTALGKMHGTNGKVMIWLSAEKGDFMRDTHPRGGGLNFQRFLI